MGIFSRRQEIKKRNDDEPIVEQNETEYNPSMSLNFLLTRLAEVDPDCVSTFYAGTSLISNSIASVPIEVKDKKTKQVIEHEIVDAFNANGAKMPKFLLIKQLVSDAYHHGNGFAYIKRASDGHPSEIIYRPPGSVSVIYNPTNGKLWYQDSFYNSGRKIEPINMIHIRKDTKDGINGISIKSIAAKILNLAKSTDSTAKDFFDSGCNISGVLTTDKPLNPKAKQEVLNDWRAAFNTGHANNVGVLGYDIKYTPIATNANDSQLLQSREFNVLEICRYLNVNPCLLAVNSGSTYNNIEQAQMDLVIHTLLPWISLIEEELNNKLILPSEKDSIYIDFDEDAILFASKADTANYYTTLVKNGIISINEARAHLGYVKKEGADDLMVAYSDPNQNKITGNKEEEEKSDEDKVQ